MINSNNTISTILRDYEQIRLNNKRIRNERRDSVYSQSKELEDLDTEIALLATKEARLRLSNDSEEAAKLNQQRKYLVAKRTSILVSLGYPDNYLDAIFTCEICEDTGYINGEKCSCLQERINRAHQLTSNLYNVLEAENFETFNVDYYSKESVDGYEQSPFDNIVNVLNKAKSFTANFESKSSRNGNLLIYGETGVGKTFLSNCIAKQLLDTGHVVNYWSSNQIFDRILPSYLINKNLEFEDYFNSLYNAEVLIIDDLGTEVTNSFVQAQLFELINRRELSGLSTIISTNLSMRQLRDRYTERVMSRIVANYTVFNIYGDNIRYQKRKNTINKMS